MRMKKYMCRTRWLVVTSLLLIGAPEAVAQNYPTRPVTIVVTTAAGGITDLVARAIGQRLSQSWGQTVVIENKGGAGHGIGAASVRLIPLTQVRLYVVGVARRFGPRFFEDCLA